MTEEEIRNTVLQALAKIAPEADLTGLGPHENLREVLDVDSFDFLQFIVGLHESTGVEIPESDYPHFANLAGTIQYLAAKHSG
jgi:acyl carrier protein